jgi:hypothetical protein
MSLSILLADAEMQACARSERLERLAARIQAILEASGGPHSVREVGRLAAARRQDVGAALQLLHDNGRAIWRPGPHGARLWGLAREAE